MFLVEQVGPATACPPLDQPPRQVGVGSGSVVIEKAPIPRHSGDLDAPTCGEKVDVNPGLPPQWNSRGLGVTTGSTWGASRPTQTGRPPSEVKAWGIQAAGLGEGQLTRVWGPCRFSGLVQFPGDVRRKVLLQLFLLLCHPFPVVSVCGSRPHLGPASRPAHWRQGLMLPGVVASGP